MTEFVKTIDESDDMRIVDGRDGGAVEDSALIIECGGYRVEVPVLTILKADASDLFPTIRRQRSPRVLTHMTRIVGYFSVTHAWNRSKIAELEDRRRGDYAVSSDPDVRQGPLPDEALAARASDMVCEGGAVGGQAQS